MSNIKALIPGTTAYNRRKFRAFYNKVQGDGEVLLEIEWPDGTLSYEPGIYKEEYNAYEGLRSELLFFSRGQGSRKKTFGAASVVQVYGQNAALVATESGVVADRRANYDYRIIDDRGEVYEFDPAEEAWYNIQDGERVAVDDGADGRVAADGGAVNERPFREVEDKLMPSAPPTATFNVEDGEVVDYEFDYDGQTYSLKEVSDYDPNPVDTNVVAAIIDYVRASQSNQETRIQDMLMGAGATFIGMLVLLGALWLMGQLGGGTGIAGLPITLGWLL